MVTKGSPGLTCTKIENKYSARMVQNTNITMKNVFVPDNNKLTHATNFAKGTNVILESSRLSIAWIAAGIGVGAYEAAVKYTI